MSLLRLLVLATLFASTNWLEAAVHIVQKGETLSTIARAYDVSVSSIKNANRIKDEDIIRIGQKLQIPETGKSYTEYKIKRGDSLSSIAAKNGLSTKELASYNGIRNANKISIGQVIRIPTKKGAIASKYSKLPSSLRATLERIPIKRGQWKYIVVHHSGTTADRAINIARFHKEERRMENGLAYHFVVENGTRGTRNGDIYIGDRWKKQLQGGHMKLWAHNQIAIGICLIGNFEKSRPKEKQMEQLEALVAYLSDRAGIPASNVTTHTLMHRKHTLCPGKYFPTKRLQSFLK